MNFISLTDNSGHTILVDVYNIALILPTDKTTVELYKGTDLSVQESTTTIKQLISDARNQAII